MDWTLKTPLHWDWETLTLFSKKDAEISKSAHQPDWKFAGGRGIHHANGNGSVNSSDAGAFSGSELGYGSSRSSISVSVGSTSKDISRTPQFNFDSVEQSPENLKKNKDLARVETGIMHRVVASDGPEKPLICLKLGKRTHLKDVSEGNNNKNPSSLSSTNLSTGLIKKPKVSQQHMQNSYCQVEGCNVDLTSAKDYHRKHKVCESHSKSPEVIVSGQERRFCQQCSRFHVLSEFDQKKRSCRRRLSDHNARRRKPHPETIPFTSSMFPASYYGLGAPVDASYSDGASDLRRALSLLSAESWVPSNPEPVSDFQFTNARTLASHSATCPTNTTTGIQQQDELPLAKPYPLNLQSNGSQFPEFQLHKTTF
nr:PREDICTED: squamosa promoter-binding-like protein 3 isoform X2 [Musa acuminata subsp. malaccensis]